MKVKIRRIGPVGPLWLRWLLFAAASVCMGLGIVLGMQLVNWKSVMQVLAWCRDRPANLVMTVLLYSLAVYLLGALTGRLWVGAIPVSAAGLALSLVDHFKNAINGTPLDLADFGLAAQAGNVAGLAGDLTPPSDFWQALVLVAFCILMLVLTQPLTAIEGRLRFVSFGAALAFAAYLLSTPGARAVGGVLDIDFYSRMDAAESHSVYGLSLGLWRDCYLEDMRPPESLSGDMSYGPEYMQEVLKRIDEILLEDEEPEEAEAEKTVPAGEKPPNILFILSESFFDLNRLPGLVYDRDPAENFHALEAESVSGIFHSHHLGYGTGYIEMSMLYGITSLDVPPSFNLCFLGDEIYERFDSLTEQYTLSGDYRAELLHGYNSSLYNRTVNYPLLGYENLYFSEEIQALGFPWSGGIYGGYYMKDSYFFQGMLERMKAINREGKSAFLYGITMENHQPFDAEKFNYQCQIGLQAEGFSEEEQAVLRVMLEGMTRADQALGYLTDALREIDEPTIVVFYGDHRPNVFMPDGDTVYTKLGLCPRNDALTWEPEQVNDLYSTDYLIWANDPALLRGQAGTRRDSSVTTLGTLLLELTGTTPSRYWALLDKVGKVSLTNLSFYFVDGQGKAYRNRQDAGLSPEQEEILDLRDAVIYDAVYGEQYICAAMNDPAGTPWSP